MLIYIFDEVCIRSLRNLHIRYANVSTLTMLQHLHDTHASIAGKKYNVNTLT